MRTDSADFTLHNSNGFRSIPSTDDRILRLEFKIDQMTSKLDMILASLTNPVEKVELPQATIKVKPENMAPEVRELFQRWTDDAQRAQQPKRLIGPPAKVQIASYINQQPGGLALFKKRAAAGYISATFKKKPAGCPPSHRYSHSIKITDRLSDKRKFEPTIFGIDEAREVVAYLESLGVNVNTSALDNQ